MGTFFSYGIDPGPPPHFMPDGRGPLWTALKAEALQRLGELGAPAEAFYEKEGLAGHAIARLGEETWNGSLRQTEAFAYPESGGCGYVFFLAMAAIACDAAFQAAVRTALEGMPGVAIRGAPTKGYNRMWNKMPGDHANDPEPRAASNIDVVRCAASFPDAQSLCDGFARLDEALGGARRTKNNYRSEAQGFRAMEKTLATARCFST